MPDPEIILDEPRTELPAQDDTAEVETPEAEKPEPTQDSEPEIEQERRGKGGFTKKIDKLTARNYQLSETNAQLQQRLEAIERRLAGEPARKPTESTKPVPDNFKTYEEYVEALADWKSEQRVAKAFDEKEQTTQKQAEDARVKEVFDSYNKRVEEARGRFEDFDEVVGRDDISIPQSVQLAIVEMDNGPEVAYYLGQHPEEAKKLLAMTPMQSVIAVGKMSATLGTTNSPEKRPVTGAPPPIKPVGAASTKSARSLEDMPQREYNRIRNEEEQKRRFR